MAAKTETVCVYPHGCVIKPLVDDQKTLESKCQSLYLEVKEMVDLEKIKSNILKAEMLKPRIESLSKQRNSLQPCINCPFTR